MKHIYPRKTVVHLHGHRIARALRALADRAERGELLGVAIAMWTADADIDMAVSGVFEKAAHMAYYAVARLKDALLSPDLDD
ncbi:hypothetical protein GCM10007933_02570 [Zoogloea oryzae]|uniref:Uncharacterized protein n=1 Tax=Zoogloea oryzae TaxID=310767 RepID=A0ABQ6F7H6_9RHOO|nr:hypothetical protein GCM10007933_02570 [Zoogloea oryzae]